MITFVQNIVLVRHGESEGNVALHEIREHGTDELMQKLNTVHTELWRLTPRGREQAKRTGKWLKKEFPSGFQYYFVSNYTRALETAALLGLQDAHWKPTHLLTERNWGAISSAGVDARQSGPIADSLAMKNRDGIWWTPEGGESLVEVLERLQHFINALKGLDPTASVLCVMHEESMKGMRILLEHLISQQERAKKKSEDPFDKLYNAHILHYQRAKPCRGYNELSPYMDRVRSVCPWDTNLSRNEWQDIENKKYSNEDLLALVEENKTFL